MPMCRRHRRSRRTGAVTIGEVENTGPGQCRVGRVLGDRAMLLRRNGATTEVFRDLPRFFFNPTPRCSHRTGMKYDSFTHRRLGLACAVAMLAACDGDSNASVTRSALTAVCVDDDDVPVGAWVCPEPRTLACDELD